MASVSIERCYLCDSWGQVRVQYNPRGRQTYFVPMCHEHAREMGHGWMAGA